MDDLEDEQECLLDYNPDGQKTETPETGGMLKSEKLKELDACSDTGSTLNFKAGLFAVKESKDKGLADMETGSEVYMSELLVSNSYNSNKYRLALTWKISMKLKNRTRKIYYNLVTHLPKLKTYKSIFYNNLRTLFSDLLRAKRHSNMVKLTLFTA